SIRRGVQRGYTGRYGRPGSSRHIEHSRRRPTRRTRRITPPEAKKNFWPTALEPVTNRFRTVVGRPRVAPWHRCCGTEVSDGWFRRALAGHRRRCRGAHDRRVVSRDLVVRAARTPGRSPPATRPRPRRLTVPPPTSISIPRLPSED